MTRAERIALARSKQRQAAALLLEAADLLDLPEGKARTVPIATASRYWFGDFLLLWRPPMAVAKALAPA